MKIPKMSESGGDEKKRGGGELRTENVVGRINNWALDRGTSCLYPKVQAPV